VCAGERTRAAVLGGKTVKGLVVRTALDRVICALTARRQRSARCPSPGAGVLPFGPVGARLFRRM